MIIKMNIIIARGFEELKCHIVSFVTRYIKPV